MSTDFISQVNGFRPLFWHSLAGIASKVGGMLCYLKDIQSKLVAKRMSRALVRKGA